MSEQEDSVKASDASSETLKRELEPQTDYVSTKRAKTEDGVNGVADSGNEQVSNAEDKDATDVVPAGEQVDAGLPKTDEKPIQTQPEADGDPSGDSAVADTKNEATLPTPAPETVITKPEHPMPKHQVKYALSMVRSLRKMKDAAPFVTPVDPVKLNIPNYFNIIKQPMDLQTVDKKLRENLYANTDEFVADMNLIVSNCETFNGVDSKISEMARNVRASFERQMKQMPPVDFKGDTPKKKDFGESSTRTDERPRREVHPPKSRDLPYMETKPRRKKMTPEMKFCAQVLKELQSKKHQSYSYPFLEPVDPVALNIPNYTKIIKTPMDLSTVQQKFDNGEYDTAAQFESDIRLIFKNCYKFNPEGTPVNLMGHRLEEVFNSKWAEKPSAEELRQSAGRRRSMHSATFDSEDEDDYSEEEANGRSIKEIEEQLEFLKNQLTSLKSTPGRGRGKKERRQSSTESKKPRKRAANGSKAVKHETIHVSYEMKKDLSERIGQLSGDKMPKVIQIIHESMPELGGSNQDEIELDVDQLNPNTTWKLYQYVCKHTPGPPAVKPHVNRAVDLESTYVGANKPKKSKPLSENEQRRQIDSIERKIKQLENKGAIPATNSGASGSGAATAFPDPASSGESASESEMESSSEEE
ncbi:hypothetical protein CANCADRAFT_30960 [Tortispora caseinolytica NRRL Y-17796]|uniref:Bromodomain-containing protein n=1 Tax=Tortispora caseinolytica NRRL Y-17796 TaxID=767744 RepID=A0A1E4TMH9_9ASCO|nr:hypothetical protein CANCADRAFT_30960 [Tortispora caseinolytica NRRL Y-17796]